MKHGVASVVATTWVVLASAAPLPDAVAIDLQPQVEVHDVQVTLGDVARIRARDPQLQAELIGLPLGRAPLAGERVRLRRDVLQRWIVARTDIDPQQIDWSDTAYSEIRLATQMLSGDRIVHCASDDLSAWLSRSDAQVRVDVVAVPADVPVPPGVLTLKARQRSPRASDAALLAKRMSVWVDVLVNGALVRTVPVDFDVNARAPAYVATRELTTGSTLAPDSLAVREVELSGRAALPLRPTDDAGTGGDTLNKLRLRRPLVAGDALSRSDVERVPVVTRGEWAMLNDSQGSLQLESRVEVLEDGLTGQTIRVRLPNASSSIAARVVGPGKLEMPL
ncbi:flagella basal body P-ring formation protein FlgA [Paraburkholderia acidicola]|uniref:Flagella basal body P-ring formation protein FlgA n=1 Tax=Paraburkholderia acidicola TaxID=1912599 RepID=A0A2A4ETU3_9BURK|nr:flagellar basal body P-ring formation chaperone FlgA [Paraburkholderia acidicola]PCE23724.1 flagella basal body P-ring formation protein FlgA [Paraburkholderia acidicola]